MVPAVSKVLLVDDDPAILRLISAWLERAGYAVQIAADGLEALQSIERECPDFLIADWIMPRLDGLELCRRVRQLALPHYVYTMLLSGHSTPDSTIVGLESGADEFLTKPVSKEMLLARLRAGTRVVALERRLNLTANTDGLTGLMTQRMFYELLQKEWARAERLHLPLSCVMLDLDFFKRVNDMHGHPAGDLALKTTAKLLLEHTRASDSLCRYGGEEFCALLPETGEEAAAHWAERLRTALASQKIDVGDERLQITGSFGVAQRYDDTQTPEQLIDQADQALLCAKRTGRDRVIRFQSLNEAGDLKIENGPQADLFEGVQARHVMTPLVVCLREEETIGQAAEFFLRSRINSTPVIDENGRLVGMLSEKDLMMTMVSLDYWQLPVRDVMKPKVIAYEEDTPVRAIYEFLCRVSIRRVVVVREGRPTGCISRATLLRWFRNLVLSKGLIERENAPLPLKDESDPHHSKQRLVETARQLARQSAELLERFQKDDEDLIPFIVGGSTGMQELLYDLLAYSRYANAGDRFGSGLQAMLAEGCCME
ncbi:MAG: diguanylate cyclase [Pirellulales bacterium]|nr:diguanylate cyclase [Pirellulales bacterium]